MSCSVKNLEILLVFLQGMINWVANRLDLRPVAELFEGWPGSNLFT